MSHPTLFDLPSQLSPRLAWLAKHEVRTHDNGAAVECDLTGDHERWLAWTRTDNPEESAIMGEGSTEEIACCELARKMGWRMWNEEKGFQA